MTMNDQKSRKVTISDSRTSAGPYLCSKKKGKDGNNRKNGNTETGHQTGSDPLGQQLKSGNRK